MLYCPGPSFTRPAESCVSLLDAAESLRCGDGIVPAESWKRSLGPLFRGTPFLSRRRVDSRSYAPGGGILREAQTSGDVPRTWNEKKRTLTRSSYLIPVLGSLSLQEPVR
eukprot:scaffold7052_cov254-Pinguiococcus_pyrenoidosus.AAC.123